MKNIKVIAVTAACVMLMGGCASSGKTAMKIGDEKITDKEIEMFATEFLGGGDYIDTAVEYIKSAYLNMEVAEAWGLSLTEEEEKTVKSNLISVRSNFGSKSDFDKMLKEYGVKEDFISNMLKESLYEGKISGAVDIPAATDEETKEFFKENFLRAKHILLTTSDMATGEEYNKEEILEKANQVLAMAQEGADFDGLIAEYNEDPGMASNSNGYIFTDGQMVSEFEEMTKSLEMGGIGMCETDYGYHIILRLPLDETPELFEEFYNNNKSAVAEAISASRKEEALNKKAEEYGIEVVENKDVIAGISVEKED